MAVVTMRQLLESGVHFGHQTRRWNPKMKRFIFTERNGIYIIDLQQSLTYIDKRLRVRQGDRRPRRHRPVRRHQEAGAGSRSPSRRPASACPTSTSAGSAACSPTSRRSTSASQRLKELEEHRLRRRRRLRPHEEGAPRPEPREGQARTRRSAASATWRRPRRAVWIVDTKKEHLAVDEAKKLGIPVVGILDTNCDPDEVEYPIPGNDDAIRSVAPAHPRIADAVAEGLMPAPVARRREADEGDVAADEPLADWERRAPRRLRRAGRGADQRRRGGGHRGRRRDPRRRGPASEAAAAEAAVAEAPAAEAAITDEPAAEAVAEAPAEVVAEARRHRRGAGRPGLSRTARPACGLARPSGAGWAAAVRTRRSTT